MTLVHTPTPHESALDTSLNGKYVHTDLDQSYTDNDKVYLLAPSSSANTPTIPHSYDNNDTLATGDIRSNSATPRSSYVQLQVDNSRQTTPTSSLRRINISGRTSPIHNIRKLSILNTPSTTIRKLDIQRVLNTPMNALRTLSTANSALGTPIAVLRTLNTSTDNTNNTTHTSRSTMILAYIGLFIAILSFSAIGPTFVYLEHLGIKPIQAVAYRSQAMLLCLLPFTLIEYIFFTPIHEKRFNYMYVPMSPQSIKRLKGNKSYDTVPSIDNTSNDSTIELQTLNNTTHNDMHATNALQRSPASKRRTIPLVKSTITDTVTTKQQTGWHALIYCVLLSISWGVSLALWVVALQYTSTPRASLFASLYPLLLVVYMKCIGMSISVGEIFGVFIALIGICVSESMALFTNEQSPHSATDRFYGDILCVLSACLVSFNVIAANKARRVMRLMTYTFTTTLGLTVIVCIMSVCIEHTTFTISNQGIFGWLQHDLLYIILIFGFVVGCIGFMGLNYAVVHVPAIIYSTSQLLDPGFTALMSYLAGLEGIPALSTIVGFCIVTCGIACVVWFEHKRKSQEEQQVHSSDTTQMN